MFNKKRRAFYGTLTISTAPCKFPQTPPIFRDISPDALKCKVTLKYSRDASWDILEIKSCVKLFSFLISHFFNHNFKLSQYTNIHQIKFHQTRLKGT